MLYVLAAFRPIRRTTLRHKREMAHLEKWLSVAAAYIAQNYDVAVEVLSVEPASVTEAARFKEDLEADILDLVELVMGLEERFDIEVPEEDLEGVTTVGHAVDMVLAKVG